MGFSLDDCIDPSGVYDYVIDALAGAAVKNHKPTHLICNRKGYDRLLESISYANTLSTSYAYVDDSISQSYAGLEVIISISQIENFEFGYDTLNPEPKLSMRQLFQLE